MRNNARQTPVRRDPLYEIPGFGPASVRDMHMLGIRRITDLRGKNPEKLYALLEKRTGAHIDRCVLYGFRYAVYYAGGGRDPHKSKWWHWKDPDGRGRREHVCGEYSM